MDSLIQQRHPSTQLVLVGLLSTDSLDSDDVICICDGKFAFGVSVVLTDKPCGYLDTAAIVHGVGRTECPPRRPPCALGSPDAFRPRVGWVSV